MTVLVVGGGLSGVAAAWAVAEAGQAVQLVQGRAGASQFASGAYDAQPWQQGLDKTPVTEQAARFLGLLGASVPSEGAWVATADGVVRPTIGLDEAVLNLQPLEGKTIAVVDLERPGWDAASLAQSYAAGAWAQRTGTRFEAVSVEPSSWGGDRLGPALGALSSFDLATAMNHSGWGERLADCLQGQASRWDAFLVGPWLSTTPEFYRTVRARLHRPLGECLSRPGETAGERFDASRRPLLEAAGVRVVDGHVQAVRRTADGWRCQGRWEPDSSPVSELYDQVVLAVGGLVGGGVNFLTREEIRGGRSFSLSLSAPVHLRLRRRDVVVHSGAQGVDLQALGMDALVDVGVSVGRGGRVDAQPGLLAVGDVVADRPRTALVAIESGLLAAQAVLSDSKSVPGSSAP